MDEDTAWYGSRPRFRPHCTRRGPSPRERGTAPPPLFSADVCCGHSRPSQLLLSSCRSCICEYSVWYEVSISALTLLVGQQEWHLACKNWVVRYWRGCLTGARGRWFAYGPADATAASLFLGPVKSRMVWMVYLSGAGLPRLWWREGC